jgi:copper homeostasis protein
MASRGNSDLMSDPILLEICADSVESALAAEQGGAHRIELCSNLLEGGVTASAGLISTVRRKLGTDLYVMVRPRGGDFCYSRDEFETMEHDVITAKRLGVNGVVFGILLQDGTIDIPRTRHLVEVARPLKTTFHRAFDMSRELQESLRALLQTGADRVLTSGGQQQVEDGIPIISELAHAANGQISIIVGGGITESNVRRIIDSTGVREIHASVREQVPSPMTYRNEKVSMGFVKGREYERTIVHSEKVRRLLDGINNGNRSANAH